VEVLAVYQTRVAKLFKNGASQAVRLPAEFRFEGSEVFVTRDEVTGDLVLSNRPGAKVWRDFFELMRSIDVPDEFMSDRPMNAPPRDRDLFFTQEA
jgi:antitoxin VapB